MEEFNLQLVKSIAQIRSVKRLDDINMSNINWKPGNTGVFQPTAS